MTTSDPAQFVRENIRAMQGYVPGEQPRGGKQIKLNTNENPYPPSPKVVTAIQHAAASPLNRYPDPVATAFRLQASDVLGVPADWILCGNGSDDLLTIMTRTFVGEGQTLRLPTPSYILYRTLAAIQNAKWEEVPFNSDWSLPSAFADSKSNPALVFLPNPNSPSGTVVPKDQIAELATKLNCPLVVDEAYADFADENCLELVKDHENLIVTRTLSKSYGLAGLRFGFLIAQPNLIEQMSKVKDSYNCDTLSISGATAAIADQKWFQENREKVLATRTRLAESLRELGFKLIDSQANFIWCQHQTKESRELYEQLKQNQILVRYMNYDGWGDGLRISVGSDDQINALLAILKSLI